jgi:hypothetical protein
VPAAAVQYKSKNAETGEGAEKKLKQEVGRAIKESVGDRQERLENQQSCSGLEAADGRCRDTAGLESTGRTRNPPSGSRLSVIVAAHCEHNQKWAVSLCGVSSNCFACSSTAEIEIAVISNWNSRPSANEVRVRPQFGFAHCETITRLTVNAQ